MKDVEKYERFEDLKKSEITNSQVSENSHETVEEFIQLLKINSREIESPSK